NLVRFDATQHEHGERGRQPLVGHTITVLRIELQSAGLAKNRTCVLGWRCRRSLAELQIAHGRWAEAVRTLVVWCPDWPVVAALIVGGGPGCEPAAVPYANRVLASSPAARAEGIRRGLRKREAQARCPHLIVVEHDPGRDARAFEPVLVAVEGLTPGVEAL